MQYYMVRNPTFHSRKKVPGPVCSIMWSEIQLFSREIRYRDHYAVLCGQKSYFSLAKEGTGTSMQYYVVRNPTFHSQNKVPGPVCSIMWSEILLFTGERKGQNLNLVQRRLHIRNSHCEFWIASLDI